MSNDIIDTIAAPFLALREFVLSNPHGHRYPAGYHASERGRNGKSNLIYFCESWGALAETYPLLIRRYGERMDAVFDLYATLD